LPLKVGGNVLGLLQAEYGGHANKSGVFQMRTDGISQSGADFIRSQGFSHKDVLPLHPFKRIGKS
jgi:hypothetical protein